MQTFGRKTHLYRSLHTNIGVIVRVGACSSCLSVMWKPADLRTGCAFTAAFGAALVWKHSRIHKWVQRLGRKQRLYFLCLWNKCVPSEQTGCCSQPSFHIAVLRSQRDGKDLEALLLLLIFCNAGYAELTPTPWKKPRMPEDCTDKLWRVFERWKRPTNIMPQKNVFALFGLLAVLSPV